MNITLEEDNTFLVARCNHRLHKEGGISTTLPSSKAQLHRKIPSPRLLNCARVLSLFLAKRHILAYFITDITILTPRGPLQICPSTYTSILLFLIHGNLIIQRAAMTIRKSWILNRNLGIENLFFDTLESYNRFSSWKLLYYREECIRSSSGHRTIAKYVFDT